MTIAVPNQRFSPSYLVILISLVIGILSCKPPTNESHSRVKLSRNFGDSLENPMMRDLAEQSSDWKPYYPHSASIVVTLDSIQNLSEQWLPYTGSTSFPTNVNAMIDNQDILSGHLSAPYNQSTSKKKILEWSENDSGNAAPPMSSNSTLSIGKSVNFSVNYAIINNGPQHIIFFEKSLGIAIEIQTKLSNWLYHESFPSKRIIIALNDDFYNTNMASEGLMKKSYSISVTAEDLRGEPFKNVFFRPKLVFNFSVSMPEPPSSQLQTAQSDFQEPPSLETVHQFCDASQANQGSEVSLSMAVAGAKDKNLVNILGNCVPSLHQDIVLSHFTNSNIEYPSANQSNQSKTIESCWTLNNSEIRFEECGRLLADFEYVITAVGDRDDLGKTPSHAYYLNLSSGTPKISSAVAPWISKSDPGISRIQVLFLGNDQSSHPANVGNNSVFGLKDRASNRFMYHRGSRVSVQHFADPNIAKTLLGYAPFGFRILMLNSQKSNNQLKNIAAIYSKSSGQFLAIEFIPQLQNEGEGLPNPADRPTDAHLVMREEPFYWRFTKVHVPANVSRQTQDIAILSGNINNDAFPWNKYQCEEANSQRMLTGDVKACLNQQQLQVIIGGRSPSEARNCLGIYPEHILKLPNRAIIDCEFRITSTLRTTCSQQHHARVVATVSHFYNQLGITCLDKDTPCPLGMIKGMGNSHSYLQNGDICLGVSAESEI